MIDPRSRDKISTSPKHRLAMGCLAFPSLKTGRLWETTRHSMAGTSVWIIPALVMKYEDICWLRTLKAQVGAGSSCFSFASIRPVGCVKQHSMTGTSGHCWWFHVETTKVLKTNLVQETFRRATKCQPCSWLLQTSGQQLLLVFS